jgi:hypothetical protein
MPTINKLPFSSTHKSTTPHNISIPLSYQSKSYTFPPTYTTTASRIYLS